MKKVHLIMPMGGAGSRFFKDGFIMPKPLIEIKGKPFLYWATLSISNFVEVEDIIFVVLQQHIDEFNIDKVIKKYFPEAKIEVIPKLLNGAVLTCMNGVKNINDDLPIIFNDCDHMFICRKFYDFCKKGKFDTPEGALLTFESNDSKYSFLEMDDNGNVINTVEKKAVSNYAICGAYYFKNTEIFLECAQEYLNNCNYDEYYVSGIYNIMAYHNMKIINFSCDMHLPFGTPEEYHFAEKTDEFKKVLEK